jgi:hypothetical protein
VGVRPAPPIYMALLVPHSNLKSQCTRKTYYLPSIRERNHALADGVDKPSKQNRLKLRTTRQHLKSEKRRAKQEWQRELAEECSGADFTLSPKKAWAIAIEIAQGYTGHFRKVPQQFENDSGDITSKDKDNVDATHAHFQSVLDRSDITMDETVLDEIDPLPIDDDTLLNIKAPPTTSKLKMPSTK